MQVVLDVHKYAEAFERLMDDVIGPGHPELRASEPYRRERARFIRQCISLAAESRRLDKEMHK